MRPNNPQRLSELSTWWTILWEAHDQALSPERRTEARQKLVERYLTVVRRYLAGALRQATNQDAAIDELVSEFGLRVMQGGLQNVSRDRGRFRDLLRVVLANLVNDHHRRRQKESPPLLGPEPQTTELPPSEQEFTEMWRDELVRRALRALDDHEQRTGEVRYTVLKLYMDHPGTKAAEAARLLSEQLGRPVDAAWVAKRAFLARQKLRELLRREVRQTLREPSDEAVEEELADVGLLAYCR